VINNYLDIAIVNPIDLRALGIAQPFPLVVKAVGSRLPIGTTPQAELTEESITAYEVAYTGTLGGDDARGGVLRQRSRRQHQLRAAGEQRSTPTRRRTRRRDGRCRRRSSRCSRRAASSCRGRRSPI
jgi:hypothetical protein